MTGDGLCRLPGEPDEAWAAFRRYAYHRGDRARVAAELDVDRAQLAAWAKRWRWARRYRAWCAELDETAEQYRRASAELDVAKSAAALPIARYARGMIRDLTVDALHWQWDVAQTLGWPIDTVGTAAFTCPERRDRL